jgi:hypothetical protein
LGIGSRVEKGEESLRNHVLPDVTLRSFGHPHRMPSG